jgi:AmmeMemoRadiSam system protein A
MPVKDVVGPESRAELLKIARRCVEAAAAGHGPPDCRPDGLPELDQPCGAFVTLNTRGGQLRGCIGSFTANKPLWQTVVEMARSAATADPRFLPVRTDELPDITIEISVLSPLERTDDPLSLELGVHGIYIRRGGRSGTFLPQVATEHNMSKEEFLATCCAHKAGLAPDAWKDPQTEVYLYTAQVFGEE